MAMAVAQHRESSSGSSINKHLDAGKYVRYTAEQVEALERVYSECPKPSSLRRQQLIRECPILSNIEPKQIKVWFQNRRCREKQRKEASRLQTVNRKLTAMNKLLMEENDRLQKQVSQLVCENGYMRQQLHTCFRLENVFVKGNKRFRLRRFGCTSGFDFKSVVFSLYRRKSLYPSYME